LPANFAPRQYCRSWSYTSHGYYYRTCYCKPYPGYGRYNCHFVVYYPSRPYYDPYKRAYWGRGRVQNNGTEVYSLPAERHRRAR
jgi:hypothetical protein